MSARTLARVWAVSSLTEIAHRDGASARRKWESQTAATERLSSYLSADCAAGNRAPALAIVDYVPLSTWITSRG